MTLTDIQIATHLHDGAGQSFPVVPDLVSSPSNGQPGALDPQERADRPELQGYEAVVYAA